MDQVFTELTRPLLIVTGPPCAGKTTLAAQLGRELLMPVIHRDVLKEILFGTLGSKDRAWSREVGGASYDLLFSFLESFLQAGYPCIAESNFEIGRATDRLKSLCETYNFTPIEILCTADIKTLRERYLARLESGERHAGHVDHLNLDDISERWANERHGSLGLSGQSIQVDTTNFGDPERDLLLKDLQQILAESS